MIGFAPARLMEPEVGAATGTAYVEKSPLRMVPRDGCRDRDWVTRTATVELHIPNLRKDQGVADRQGYGDDWLREALARRGTKACIPARAKRKAPIPHDPIRYKQRHKVEIMFGRLKDWRRIATRYDRCPTPSFLPSASRLPSPSDSDQ